MIFNIIKFIQGYVRVKISGYSLERFINLCSARQILIWDILSIDNGYEFYLSYRSFKELEPISKKTGTKVKIISKHGLPYLFHKYRKRKFFAIGMMVAIFFVYYMSLFIWDINVIGNEEYTSEEITEYIENNYVWLGVYKKNVDCNELEKKIRNNYPNISWISCEIKGTQLNVDIKEGSIIVSQNEGNELRDIVAYKDATITSIITRNGTPLIKRNDYVHKGDVLISGVIYIYDDYKEVLDTNYIAADGEIYGETIYEYNDTFNIFYYEKEYTGEEKKYISFNVINKAWTPYSPKDSFVNKDIVTDIKKIHIGNTFYLPFSFSYNVIKEYVPVYREYTEEEAYNKANERVNKYIDNLLEKGVEILENNVKIEIADGVVSASGQLITVEQIGVTREITINDGGTSE